MIQFRTDLRIWPRVDERDVQEYLSENVFKDFLRDVDVEVMITLSHGPFVDYANGIVIDRLGIYRLPEHWVGAAPPEASNLSWPDIPTDDLAIFGSDGYDLSRMDINLTTGNLLEIYQEYCDSSPFGVGYVLQRSEQSTSLVAPVLYMNDADGDFDPLVKGFSLFRQKAVCQTVHQWLVGSGFNFRFDEVMSVLRPNLPINAGIIAFIPRTQQLSFVLTSDTTPFDSLDPEISNLPLEDEHTIGFFVIKETEKPSRLLRLSDYSHVWNSSPRGVVEVKGDRISQSRDDPTVDDGDDQVVGQSFIGRIVNGMGSIAILLTIYFLFRNK